VIFTRDEGAVASRIRWTPNGTSLRHIILTSLKGMPATCCRYRSDACDMSCRYERWCFDRDTFPTHQPNLTRFIKGGERCFYPELRLFAKRVETGLCCGPGWWEKERRHIHSSFDQTTSVDSHSNLKQPNNDVPSSADTTLDNRRDVSR
jgi:hypothetical protein